MLIEQVVLCCVVQLVAAGADMQPLAVCAGAAAVQLPVPCCRRAKAAAVQLPPQVVNIRTLQLCICCEH